MTPPDPHADLPPSLFAPVVPAPGGLDRLHAQLQHQARRRRRTWVAAPLLAAAAALVVVLWPRPHPPVLGLGLDHPSLVPLSTPIAGTGTTTVLEVRRSPGLVLALVAGAPAP